MNTWIVIGALYVLGYFNPDTRDAFMWAGLIVSALIGCVGLGWMIGRLARASKNQGKEPVAVAASPLIEAEQRFKRGMVEVTETESDTIGV